MQIPDGHAGEKWTDILGWSQGEIEIGDDVRYPPVLLSFRRADAEQGWAEFRSPARSVSVWAKKDARGRSEFGVKI